MSGLERLKNSMSEPNCSTQGRAEQTTNAAGQRVGKEARGRVGTQLNGHARLTNPQ